MQHITQGRSFYDRLGEGMENNKENPTDLLGKEIKPPLTEDELVVALDGELIAHYHPVPTEREVRVINQSFSLAEYDNSWTKIEWFLFIEIYNIVKEFYLDRNDHYIASFTEENITVRVPINRLDPTLFNIKNRSAQLRQAAEGLMDKRVRNALNDDESGQMGFDFITMFPRITYDPKNDREHVLVRIQSEIYEEMVPIEKYAQLDLKLLKEITTGNGQRLYAIFKSHSFRSTFDITITDLRKQMGFFEKNVYPEWKYFNDQVLKPAVKNINKHKEYDIEVDYSKKRDSEKITFKVKHHSEYKKHYSQVLNLDQPISLDTRVPNRIQRKYINSTIRHCSNVTEISNTEELNAWIISDLIGMQKKQGSKFNFKRAMNGISKQIQTKIYTEPYSHKHMIDAPEVKVTQPLTFDERIHTEIKKLELKGLYDEIRQNFSDEELRANQYGHLIANFEEEEQA